MYKRQIVTRFKTHVLSRDDTKWTCRGSDARRENSSVSTNYVILAWKIKSYKLSIIIQFITNYKIAKLPNRILEHKNLPSKSNIKTRIQIRDALYVYVRSKVTLRSWSQEMPLPGVTIGIQAPLCYYNAMWPSKTLLEQTV